MPNVLVVPSLKFHVLSNGVLAFAVSLILCTGIWKKLFTEALLAFKLNSQNISLNFQGKQVHHLKERDIFCF